MKSLKLLTVTLALTALVAASTQAIPITGSVDMSGTATLDSTLLGSAGSATAFTGVTVGGVPTGSYAGTFGDSVTWKAFGWNPSTAPVTSLWSYHDIVTGFTYTFDLASVTVKSQDNTFLNLLGTGTLNITGVGSPYDATSGSWSFTISNPDGGAHANFAFTFANSQTAVLPDGGATVMLLGAALSGLALIRRKLV